MSKPKVRRENITLSESARASIIKRIRADKIIGIGTCSVVDECWTDSEILEYCAKHGYSGACAATAEFRRVHRAFQEREREIRNEIF